MPELIGYARVSSRGQNLDSQIDILNQVGCKKIFQDKATGASETRPDWDKLLQYVRGGDIIVVVELSRMTRSLKHLLQLADDFQKKDISIKSVRESIDTSTATGRAFFSIIGAINQMERELKSERTAAGRASAKARGKTGGRPRTDKKKLQSAMILYDSSDFSADEVCKISGVSKRTFFRYMEEMRKAEFEAKEEERLNPPKILSGDF